jgi:hypothetical protein
MWTEKHRDLAVRNLMRLATPQRVHALWTHAALGQLWRSLVLFRVHDKQVVRLCDVFSAAVQDNEDMQAWVESTYNEQVRLPIFCTTVLFPGRLLLLNAVHASYMRINRFCRQYHPLSSASSFSNATTDDYTLQNISSSTPVS